MTAPACGSCGSPVNGATICAGCTRDLAAALLTAASIAADLDDAVARQLRHGSSARYVRAEIPLPIDARASDVTRALAACLNSWTAALHMPPEPWPADGIAATARWLGLCLPRIRQHPRAAEMREQLRARVAAALAVLDGPRDLLPAGDCENCGSPLLAERDADQAACRCGWVTPGIAARRARRAAEADMLDTPEALAAQASAIGVSVTSSVIRKWASRGRLLARPGGAYALSDVLALCAQRDGRRSRA